MDSDASKAARGSGLLFQQQAIHRKHKLAGIIQNNYHGQPRMADEGTEHPNAKYGSKIIHGDEKGKLLEKGSKIHGAQADKRGGQHGSNVVAALTVLCCRYPAFAPKFEFKLNSL